MFYVGISWHTQEPQLVFADTGEFLFEEAPVEAYANAQPVLALIHELNQRGTSGPGRGVRRETLRGGYPAARPVGDHDVANVS